jgi:hypothetical protein
VAAQDSDAANAAAPAGTVRRVDRAASGTAATTAINDAIDEDEHWKTAPDYLKRPRGGKWKPVLIGMLIAFCLAMAGLRGMGPFDESHPLASRLGRNRVDVPTVTADAGAAAMPPSPTNELTADPADRAASGKHANAGHERPVADALQAEPSATPANDQRDPAQASLPLDSEVDPALADASEAETVNLDPVAPAQQPLGESVDAVHEGLNDAEMPAHAVNQEEQETLESEGEPAIAANPSREALPTEPLFDPVASTNEGGAAPEDELPPSEPRPPVLIDPLATNTTNESPVADTASAERLDAMPTEVRATPADAEGVDAGHSPARSMEVGRFLDPQQVLTRFQASSGLWHRIPVGTLLQVGDTLMSLPTYRTPLALASGMQVTMIGPTRLEILPVGDANTPEFQLAYGRLAVATLAQAGTTFRLRWAGNHEATLLLADMNTTVAVALEHHRLPGTDPITRPAHRVLQVFVTSGSAEWRADDAAPIQLLPGQRLTMVDEFVPQLTEVEELPSWVDGRDARPRDPIAARELSRLMTTERPVTLVLQEQSSSKREEIRSLAACSLAYLGDVAPLLVALNDSGLRSYWNAQHEVLMDLVAMSPDSAELLRSAILQRHGEQTGESLYRMLWSFSPQQLDDGAAEQLVNALDHPSFDFRIVASELLKSITGLPSLYRPHASAREPQRRTATNRWRKHLQDGEIVYGEPPAIVSWLQATGGSAPDETDQAETPEARNAPANVQPSGDAGAVLRP